MKSKAALALTWILWMASPCAADEQTWFAVALGDPQFSSQLLSAASDRLRDLGVQPDLSMTDGSGSPSQLSQIAEQKGADALIVIEVISRGQQTLQYYGQTTLVNRVQIQARVLSTYDQKWLGDPMRVTTDYTEFNLDQKAKAEALQHQSAGERPKRTAVPDDETRPTEAGKHPISLQDTSRNRDESPARPRRSAPKSSVTNSTSNSRTLETASETSGTNNNRRAQEGRLADSALGTVSEPLVERDSGSSDPFNRFLQEPVTPKKRKPEPRVVESVSSAPLDSSGPAEQAFDFAMFSQPRKMEAFYSGNTAALENDAMRNIIYAGAINNKLLDQGTLLLVENTQLVLLTVDPSLGNRASRKMASNSQAMNDATGAGMGTLMAFFGAIVETRRSGGSVQDEVNSSFEALADSPTARIDVLRQQAEQDGLRLAILADSAPDAFKRIYAGLKQFILQ